MYINVITIETELLCIAWNTNQTLIVEGDLEQIIPASSQFQAILHNELLQSGK